MGMREFAGRFPILVLPLLMLLSPGNLAFAASKEKIIVTGASTIAPLLGEMAHRYEDLHAGIQIDVQSGGSSRGISDLRRGVSDIGMVSRTLNEDERDLAAVTIARDGVAMIVHADNPVAVLKDDQIRAIYTGRITRWEEVGGAPGPITIVGKAEGRSTLEVFLAHLGLSVQDVKPHIVIGDNEQAVKVVAGNPGAIGYVSIGTTEYHISAGTPLKAIALGPVAATSANVADGTYAASRPLNLITLGPRAPWIEEFLAFATSEGVHDLIRDQYFVPATK